MTRLPGLTAAGVLLATMSGAAQRQVCGQVVTAACYDGVVEVTVDARAQLVSLQFAKDVGKRSALDLLYKQVCVAASKRKGLSSADVEVSVPQPALEPLDPRAAHPCGAQVVQLPQPTRRNSPGYPPALRHVTGVVLIEGVVEADGSLGPARVLHSPFNGVELAGETLRALRRWRFKPGTADGIPAPVLMNFTFEFESN